jgi:hypothetical protein
MAVLATASWNSLPLLSRLRDHTGQVCSGPNIGFSFSALTRSFFKTDSIPTVMASEYKGYYISAWARREFTNGYTSVGIVYERGQFGSIIQVQRIEGELLESKEQAGQHGLELCKEWIDKQTGRST